MKWTSFHNMKKMSKNTGQSRCIWNTSPFGVSLVWTNRTPEKNSNWIHHDHFFLVVKLEGKCWKRPNLLFVYENPTMFFWLAFSETTSDLLKRPNQTTNGKMGANQGKPGAACGDNSHWQSCNMLQQQDDCLAPHSRQVSFRVNQPESYGKWLGAAAAEIGEATEVGRFR